jgi:uncharacterized protein YjbI with pentapeptide repeats
MDQTAPCFPVDPQGRRHGRKLTRRQFKDLDRRRNDPTPQNTRVRWGGQSRPNTGLDLRGVNFQQADLNGCRLARADLEGADLSHANLMNANLYNANLIGAKL